MKKAKEIRFVVIIEVVFILSIFSVKAATIQGNIYGPDLEIAKKAIVEINSTPKQSLVANTGHYSFVVPQGSYEIEAFYTIQGTLLYDKEIITVPAEGSFTLDLILFETPDIEDIEFDESELKMIEDLLKERKKTDWTLIGGIIAILLLAFIIIYLILRERKKAKSIKRRRKFRAKAIKEKLEEEKPIGDEAMKKTLEILKRERRVTQKDIRKELKLSEAKMSLIIADLEAQGKVRKIKRGRGNIIIYQE
ncbi:MAG: hypothetical protein QW484_03460 [Candidatus Pacearchaeota archaeon]